MPGDNNAEPLKILMQGCWKTVDLLGSSAKRYNAPFTVHQAVWNPSIDLIALASEKGEVNTRRRLWKRGWKVNLSGIKPLPQSQSGNDEASKLSAICWSPGGMFLTVGFRNGIIHLLDCEHGNIVYSISLGCTIKKMRWDSFEEKVKIEDDDRIVGIVGEIPLKSKKSEKTNAIENIDLLKSFCDRFFASEILGAVLLVIDEDHLVHVLAAGILPVLSISPPMLFFEKCDPYSITIGDVRLWKNSQLLVAYSSFGESSESKSESTKSCGYNTQIVTFNIDSLGCFKNGSIWRITYRWLRLYYSVCCVSDAFSKMTADWEEQSKHFHQAFERFDMRDTDGQILTVGECLIGHILSGNSDIELQRYFRELSEMDWKKMKEWVGRGFGKLITMLKNELLTSVELYQHHLKRLVTDLGYATQRFGSINILPKRIFDVDVYPYGGYDEEPESTVGLETLKKVSGFADQLQFKVAELIAVATRNREQLLNFMRWLSFTAALKNKGSLVEPTAWIKYDFAQLIEFIVEMFVLPDKRNLSNLAKQVRSLYQCPKTALSEYLGEVGVVGNKEKVEKGDDGGAVQSEVDPVVCLDQVIGCISEPNEQTKVAVTQSPINSRGLDSVEAIKDCAKITLAQCVKNCTICLDLLRGQILEIYALLAKPVLNVYVERTHPEGFSTFDFFLFRISGSLHLNAETKNAMKLKFGNEAFPALSCISSDGSRHFVYASSGELISRTVFDEGINNEQNRDIETFDECSDGKLKNSLPSTTVNQPLSIDTTAGTSRTLPAACSPVVHRCLIKFEAVDDGSYFGLIRAKKGSGEFTYLFRAFFGDETAYVHEEQSGIESYKNVIVSGSKGLGIVILEPQYTFNGSCLRWFEFTDTPVCLIGNKRTVLGEVDTGSSVVPGIDVPCKVNKEMSEEDDDYELEQPTSTYRLRRRSRKGKLC